MKVSMFEFGLNKDRYYKKAGEAIDTYAAEHDVTICSTEELVKEIAHLYLAYDIIKGGNRVGGTVAFAALAQLAKSYAKAAFGGRILGAIFGTVAAIGTSVTGAWTMESKKRDLDAQRDRKIEALLEEASTPSNVIDITDSVSSDDDKEAAETETEESNDIQDEEKAAEPKSFTSKVVAAVVCFGLGVYLFLGLCSWGVQVAKDLLWLFGKKPKVAGYLCG